MSFLKRPNASKEAFKRVCMLKPMTAEDQPIQLNGGINTVGRSKETGIRDVRCSKHQLELNVDLSDSCRIKLKVLGVNPSSINGLMAMQGTECDVEHGDVLELIYGRHSFEVVFQPAPISIATPIEQKPCDANENTIAPSWDSVADGKMLVYTSANVRASSKIAGYDIDGTIIKTLSGNVFPKTTDDWQLNYPEQVTQKLKRLHENGYKICFFTNQGGIARGKVKLDDFKCKIRNILERLKVPVQVFIAIADGYYRKPLPGMWEHLQKEKNDGIALELSKCFFVGDAAGRPQIGTGSTKRRKDHSLADRLFAKNVNISFYTPEEHFVNQSTEDWIAPDFDPFNLQVDMPNYEPSDTKVPANSIEMIIMVGLPGSGKSHFTQHYLKNFGYIVANADTLGSVKSCLTACENAFAAGKSCVVDNTNVDVESRKKFIDLATNFNIPCRCFEMNVQLAHIRHNIAFRELTDAKHSKINDMIFNSMKKKYKSPTLDEGFNSIVKVNIIPNFKTDEHKRLYQLYLVEK